MSAKTLAYKEPSTPNPAPQRIDVELLLLWLITSYMTLILGCSLWLHSARGVMAGGQELTYDRCVFLSVSTATLTGFQMTVGPNDFNSGSAQGPWILLMLTLGGTLFALIGGGLAAARIFRLPLGDTSIIVGAIEGVLLAVLAGTAVMYTARGDMLGAALQSACAFANSGAVITTGNRLPAFTSWQAQFILLPLSILGGMGLTVLMELYAWLLGTTRTLTRHTRLVVILTAGVYVVATLLLLLATLVFGPHDGTMRNALAVASTTAIDTRSAGLPFAILNYFPGPGLWLLILLMMIGASPAGTGGGIKVTAFWHLFRGIHNCLYGKPVPRSFAIAAIWIAGYGTLAATGFVILSALLPQLETTQLAFITISALSNVGLSHDPISITGPGLYLLDLIMLAGRLAPLAVLWWMALSNTEAEVLVA